MSVELKSKVKELTPNDVFLFIPNLIGYSRIIFAGLSLYTMKTHPFWTFTFYFISCILDAFDGTAARAFNQCTKFGAVLDMVTDRCTTTCLLCYLSQIYPNYFLLFQLLISLDISSHYMHMYSSLNSGAKSHKIVDENSNPILKAYYSNNTVLFLFCFGNESFFILLYLLKMVTQEFAYYNLILFATVICFPICIIKQSINLIQFIGASKYLAQVDVEEREMKNSAGNGLVAPCSGVPKKE